MVVELGSVFAVHSSQEIRALVLAIEMIEGCLLAQETLCEQVTCSG